jgi:hypothetical protein
MKKNYIVVIMFFCLLFAIASKNTITQAFSQDPQPTSASKGTVHLVNTPNLQLQLDEAAFSESNGEHFLIYRVTNLSKEAVTTLQMSMVGARNKSRFMFLSWRQKINLAPGKSDSFVFTFPKTKIISEVVATNTNDVVDTANPNQLLKADAFSLAVEQIGNKKGQRSLEPVLLRQTLIRAAINDTNEALFLPPQEGSGGEGGESFCDQELQKAVKTCGQFQVKSFFCDAKNMQAYFSCKGN